MTFHETILKKLLEYRATHPHFRFVPRQRNNNNRLENGYWFQGEDYAFVGLFDRSGGINKTRSLGLVFWVKPDNKFGCYVELVYKGEEDKSIIETYDKLRNHFGGFKEVSEQKYQKYLPDTDESFESVIDFLNSFYPQLIKLVNEENQDDLIINERKFNTILTKINQVRNKLNNSNVNKLLINITWNSKDWKDVSDDQSNHRWVKEGGTPGESLNFAKDADGNSEEHIFGYAKFTHEPKIEGPSIFIFYSQSKIVGFYGNAELIHKEIEEGIILNLKGEQNLSFVLENKIDNAKELGFLEDKERVGMINFNYIEHNKTVISILNKALELNPNQENEIIRLQKWFLEKTNYKEEKLDKLDELIKTYVDTCEKTDWLDNELYKFEWAKWVHDKTDFNEISSDAMIYQIAMDSQKVAFTGSTGVQFIKQGAREQMSKYIGIDDIRYFREFREGKTLNEIGFEFRNMSFPIVSCWLSVFFPEKIYPVSRTSFADVVRKLFNAKVNNSNIAFIESLQEYCLQIDTKLKAKIDYQTVLKGKLQLKELSQLQFNWAVQDFLLYLDRHPELFNINTTFTTQTKDIMSATNLNQILFGPPGTGKTFNTINEALKIVDPSYFEEHQRDRKKLTDRFKELLIKDSDENKGQIAFCTFHQSFSYEDFVEGIKPKTTESKSVFYHTEPGVFKRICQLADSYNSTVKVKTQGILSWNEEQFNKASFYKLSLGEANNPDDREIYEYCRDNGYIAIGFGQENDFSGLSESDIKEKCEDLKLESIAGQQMYTFIHYLKKNNYVLISNGNKYIRAIGKVTGDYEYKAESPIRYNHFRKVEWLFVDENIPVEEIYNIGLSQRTMYKIDESLLKRDFFTNNGQESLMPDLVKEEKNYVLIIDEINRGNVSSIFGELITLIEKDKRAGCDEELEVTLPYSKEPFKVPSNVYLIGTMNTADRSIEALDTALRRRFSFKEFQPKPHLIKTEGASSKNNGMVDGIDLENLLNTINTRIEKLIDKDHKIGHSYFLKVNNKEKLVHAFKNEIIPLLEEYFFGDYGKIGLVLGSSFVEKVNHDFDFANFEHYDADIQSDLKEKAVFRIKNEDQWDFTTI